MKINKKSIFVVFMILQVLFDNKLLYSDTLINTIGFSPTTIIRFLFIGILFLFVFFEKDNKNRWSIIIYCFTFLIYTIIHHVVSSGINNSLILNTLNYNFIDEIQYLLVLLLPMLVIYITYRLKLDKKDLYYVVRYTCLIVSIIMVICNISLLAYKSYGEGLIQKNILYWFFGNTEKIYMASKGFFNSANQISGLLVLLFPMLFYYLMKYNNKMDLIICLLIILSSYMLGTRISAIGIFIVTIVLSLAYIIYYGFINKKRIKNMYIYLPIIVIFSLISYTKAPIVNCYVDNYSCIFNNVKDEGNYDIKIKREDYISVCDYLMATPTNTAFFKELYPCEEFPEFWEEFSKNQSNIGSDNRNIEELITKDIYKRISNKKVDLFGMGRSRFLSAKMYLEKDIKVHRYTIGFIGILIFICPYIIICLLALCRMIKNRKIDVYTLSIVASIMLTLLVSILTGHVIDELIVSLFIGLFAGCLLNVKEERK